MRIGRVLFSVTLAFAMLGLFAGAGIAAKGDTAPVPIPQTYPGTPFHVLAPGPAGPGLPFLGEDVDPSTITNLRALVGYSVAAGTALGSDGVAYDMVVDMRFMRGVYVAADGTHHFGTFGFI